MLRNDDVSQFYLGFGEGGSRKNIARREALQAAQTLAVLRKKT